MRHKKDKLLSTLGFILNLIFIAIPKDLWQWMSMRKKNVQGKNIVITGGGSGIGQRLAEIFAIDLGANVAILDIDQAKAENVAAVINEKSTSGIARAWRCDVSDVQSVEESTNEIRSCFATGNEDNLGEVDIVICNAAVLYFGLTLELDTESLQRAFDVNIIRAFLPGMEARNSGQIVTISSVAGHYGESYGMAYCPSKFAVRGIMEVLEMELHDRGLNGIVCTTVFPWFVRTPMILNMGMRPTSRWISFMSINRCANQIVDAVLKEKKISFVPCIVRVMAMLKPFFSNHVQLAFRSYLNCRYEPIECQASSEKKDKMEGEEDEGTPSLSTIGNMGDFFKTSHPIWFTIIPFGLLLTFIVYWDPELFNTPVLSYVGHFLYYLGTQFNLWFLIINIAAWAAHLGEAVYALYVCDKLGFSHACSLKWFAQTFLLGFPSLSILISYRKKINK